MEVFSQKPTSNTSKSSSPVAHQDKDSFPRKTEESVATVSKSCWKFPWPQVFQSAASPSGAEDSSQRERKNPSPVLNHDSKSPRKTSSNVSVSSNSSHLSQLNDEKAVSSGCHQSQGPSLAKDNSTLNLNQIKPVSGRTDSFGEDEPSAGGKGHKVPLSLHSQVSCLNKEEMDKIARERMMTLVRGMLAAQNLQGDNLPIEIEKGLFVGSASASRNKAELQKKKITHVLTVANSLSPPYPSHFKYKLIEVLDSPEVDLQSRFSQCFEFIEDARKNKGGVLVHCFAGRSRSVTVVVAYLMKTHGLTLSSSLEKVRAVRPEACPNFGFMFQLKDFEKKLQAEGIVKS